MMNKVPVVISDDTNFNEEGVKLFQKMCDRFGYMFQMQDITDVPLDVCIERDNGREGPARVGEKVIRGMANKAGLGKKMKEKEAVPVTDPYLPESMTNLPLCIIVDIDGTVAEKTDARGYYEWDKVYTDNVRPAVLFTVLALYHSLLGVKGDTKLFFKSGRDEVSREGTMRWFEDKTLGMVTPEDFSEGRFELLMRSKGDQRRDSIIKNELFDKHIRGKYAVFAVFDDRPQVIEEVWLPKGVTVFNVGNGRVF